MFSVKGACVGGHCPQAEIDGTSMLARRTQLKPSNTVLANTTGADTMGADTIGFTNLTQQNCNDDPTGTCNGDWQVCDTNSGKCVSCGNHKQVCCARDSTMKGPDFRATGYCKDHFCDDTNTCNGRATHCGKLNQKCCTTGPPDGDWHGDSFIRCPNHDDDSQVYDLGCHKGKCIKRADCFTCNDPKVGYICSEDTDCAPLHGAACVADPTDEKGGKLCFQNLGSCECKLRGENWTGCPSKGDSTYGCWTSWPSEYSWCGYKAGKNDYECCDGSNMDIKTKSCTLTESFIDVARDGCNFNQWPKSPFMAQVTGTIKNTYNGDDPWDCDGDQTCTSSCSCSCVPQDSSR